MHVYSKKFDENATHINARHKKIDIFKPHPELKFLLFSRIKILHINQKIEKLFGAVDNDIKLPASLIEATLNGNGKYDFSECINLKILKCISRYVDVSNVKMLDTCNVSCKTFIYNNNIKNLSVYGADQLIIMSKLKTLEICDCKQITIEKSNLESLSTDIIFDFPDVIKLHITKYHDTIYVPFITRSLKVICRELIADKNCHLSDLEGSIRKMPKALLNLQKYENNFDTHCYMPKLQYVSGHHTTIYPTRVKVSIDITF
jgi:hypothetical protein